MEKNFVLMKMIRKNFKKCKKVRDYCHYTGKYRGAAHSICNLRYKISKEIPVVFHNGSTYDYHFIIKQLARKFKGNFECLGENTEKYITFSVRIKKEHDNGKATTYKLKFIDSYRFMQDSLSNLVDNLSEINNKELDNTRSTNASLVKSMDYYRYMQDSLSNLVSCLSKINNNKFTDNIRSMTKSLIQSIDSCRFMQDELTNIVNNKTPYVTLIEKFPNTSSLCNKDLNKFKLLLRKGVYPYEYMDRWKRFKEESLPDKTYFTVN